MTFQKTKTSELLIGISGNILMWYNFALFMPFLHIFSRHFFPTENEILNSIFSFLALSVGLFVRPIGASIFGPIGDKIGRGRAISISILFMVFPTFAIAFIPSYTEIGIISPILLIICRFLQGISLGGGYSSSMVNLVELAPKNKRGFYGSWSDVGAQIGVLLAVQTLIILHIFFEECEIYKVAWKYPFLSSLALLPFAFLISDNKKIIKNKLENKKQSIIQMMSQYKKESLCVIGITAFSSIGFYTLLTFFPFFLVRDHILTLREATVCSLCSNVSIILSAAFFGFLSDKFSRKLFIRIGMTGVTVCMSLAFLLNIKSQCAWMLAHSSIGLFHGMYFSSRAAFFAESFPAKIRCTGVSVSLSIAQAVIGGSTAMIMNYCSSISNIVSILPITIAFLCGMLAVANLKDRTGQTLE